MTATVGGRRSERRRCIDGGRSTVSSGTLDGGARSGRGLADGACRWIGSTTADRSTLATCRSSSRDSTGSGGATASLAVSSTSSGVSAVIATSTFNGGARIRGVISIETTCDCPDDTNRRVCDKSSAYSAATIVPCTTSEKPYDFSVSVKRECFRGSAGGEGRDHAGIRVGGIRVSLQISPRCREQL